MKALFVLSLAVASWTAPGDVAAAQPSRCRAPTAKAKAETKAEIEHFRAAEESLREFAWDEMAGFFADAAPGDEPTAREDLASTSAALSFEEALLEAPRSRTGAIRSLAAESTLDRLSKAGERQRERAFRGLPSTAISALLEADDPTIRANVWLWLATSTRGACPLAHLEQARFTLALGDRSEVVDSGDDLVLRRVGDYALAAYLRRLGDDPSATTRLLQELTRDDGARKLPPRMRALAASLVVRRGDTSRIDEWLGAEDPALRLAVALAALSHDRARWEREVLDAAARDTDDLVTQTIVDRFLDLSEERRGGEAPLELIEPQHARLAEAALRWQGEGDPRVALPQAPEDAVAPAVRSYQGMLAAR